MAKSRSRLFLGRRDYELTAEALRRVNNGQAVALAQRLDDLEKTKGKHGALRVDLTSSDVSMLRSVYSNESFDRETGRRLTKKLEDAVAAAARSTKEKASRRKWIGIGRAMRNAAAAGRSRRARHTTGR